MTIAKVREILKVRSVGETLVVTIPKSILRQIPLNAGDRVLVETSSVGCILISKENGRGK